MPTCTSAPQGVHDFLRAYYHHKSADWKDNAPYKLQSWSAGELAKLPTYYVMDLAEDMAATVAKEMPSAAEIAANQWLPDSELAFYSAEYARNGFQGGLQWYRCGTSGAFIPELQIWSGRTIDQPSCLHLRQAGLGHLSAARRVRGDANQSLHQHDRLPSRRRRRALGAAGAAGGSEPVVAGRFCKRLTPSARAAAPEYKIAKTTPCKVDSDD